MKEDYRIPFSLQSLWKYAIIDGPCTAAVRCVSSLDYEEGIYAHDGHNRWIANLGAVKAESLVIIEKMYYSYKKQGITLYYDQIGHLLMSGAIWENQIFSRGDLPVKGEMIIAVFGTVNGDVKCTNISTIPKSKPKLYEPAEALLEEINYLNNL